jgi:hypothetical protein
MNGREYFEKDLIMTLGGPVAQLRAQRDFKSPLRVIAYHEAGHIIAGHFAVIAKRPWEASICPPCPDVGGFVRFSDPGQTPPPLSEFDFSKVKRDIWRARHNSRVLAVCAPTPVSCHQVFRAARRSTEELIEKHWRAVELMGEALYERGVLSGAEIDSILSSQLFIVRLTGAD